MYYSQIFRKTIIIMKIFVIANTIYSRTRRPDYSERLKYCIIFVLHFVLHIPVFYQKNCLLYISITSE